MSLRSVVAPVAVPGEPLPPKARSAVVSTSGSIRVVPGVRRAADAFVHWDLLLTCIPLLFLSSFTDPCHHILGASTKAGPMNAATPQSEELRSNCRMLKHTCLHRH